MNKRVKRIQVELTSEQGDTWTWRKAGAKQPKGEIGIALLPKGSRLGDQIYINIITEIDGIIVESASPLLKEEEKADEYKTLEFIGGKNFEKVTLVSKKKNSNKKKKRPQAKKPKERPKMPDSKVELKKPAAKLSPKQIHRAEWIKSLPEEQRPVAEKLSKGGLPAIRSSIEKDDNIKSGQELIALAEKLQPGFRLSEWKDRADAALEGIEKIRLQDLRAVLAAAEGLTQKKEIRETLETLRTKLNERVEAEHAQWLADINTLLEEGRIIRALNSSGYPPKAGMPLPAEVSQKLVESANAALTADVPSKRWISFLEAISKSPIAGQIVPSGVPEVLSPELVDMAGKFKKRIPQIADLLLQKKNADKTTAL